MYQDGVGFQEHEVTDISQYDTNDTSALVWFAVLKATGKGLWLPPYFTENLDERVISYNVPVYWEDRFVGVIGIEIDYDTLVKEAEKIKVFESGYAFILDDDSNVIYHPHMDSEKLELEVDAVDDGAVSSDARQIRYTFDGTEKQAAWMSLSNGMRLYVAAPMSEINSSWFGMIWTILIVSLVALAIVCFVNLTTARKMAVNDSLTGVKNKHAYVVYEEKINAQIEQGEQEPFAVVVCDVNNLKTVNDLFGHKAGDACIRKASSTITEVFPNSPVFRTGGDEFVVLLFEEDYAQRTALMEKINFLPEDRSKIKIGETIAAGMVEYSKDRHPSLLSVFEKADKAMYERKQYILTVEQDSELDCLKSGAVDFIPKQYPTIEIVKARIARSIELSEDRELIRYTERDKLTGLLNKDYFLRYVNRLDHIYQGNSLDAVVCDVNRFHSVNKLYGRQFGDRVLRSIGDSMKKLAQKTGGIGCRKEGDIFLLYCPHQIDYGRLFEEFLSDMYADAEMQDKIFVRFGVFSDAQQVTDVEERFVCATIAADRVKDDPQIICGFYDQE